MAPIKVLHAAGQLFPSKKPKLPAPGPAPGPDALAPDAVANTDADAELESSPEDEAWDVWAHDEEDEEPEIDVARRTEMPPAKPFQKVLSKQERLLALRLVYGRGP